MAGETDAVFSGFVDPEANYCRLPLAIIENLHVFSSKAELCVVLYILRHTWGFREYDTPKPITVDEFEKGRKRKDGTRIDNGTGLTPPSIRSGLESAEKHGFISVVIDDTDMGRIKKSYLLKMSDTAKNAQESSKSSQIERSLPPDSKLLSIRGKEVLPRTEIDTLDRDLEIEEKEIPAPIVADTPPIPEPTIVEAGTPALPIGEGKILAFPSAMETSEDTPPRAEFHAVTATALGITGAAYPIIEKWVNFLTGNTPEYTTPRGKKKPTHNGKFYELQVTPGMSIDEIGAFGRWYRATHPGKTPYTTCEGLNVDVAKFRAAKDHDRYVERFYHDRTDVIIVDDSALPKAAGAEGDAIPISADKRAEAERIMAELLAKMNGNGVKRDSTNRQ